MDHVQTERSGGVLRIAINRPEKKNALTGAMYTALAESVERAELDPEVRVLLLHGNGNVFTAGNDLEDFLRKPWKDYEVPPAVRFIRAATDAKKPIVAAIQGVAVGIGVTILLHCDLVYAAQGTSLIAPFINLGIVTEAGSSYLLPATIGYQRAAELLMLGEPFTAERAYEIGLVNSVVPAEELSATAMAVAQKLAAKPAAALRATKELLKRGTREQVHRAIHDELEILTQRLDSPETREALSAFLEKRKPDFSQFR